MEENQKQRRRRKILYARTLRKNMTQTEKILWDRLRAHRCAGLKFRRQAPVSWFIADFLCMQHSLIIEVDGSIHATQTEYDEERDHELENLGYRVLRFSNNDIRNHLDDCIARIIDISKNSSLSSRERGRHGEGGPRGPGEADKLS